MKHSRNLGFVKPIAVKVENMVRLLYPYSGSLASALEHL